MTNEKLLAVCRFLVRHRILPIQLGVLLLVPELTATEIARRLKQPEANVHAAIRSLRKRGFIEQVPHPTSKKAKVLVLTNDTGVNFMQKFHEEALK